jgi:hypothetical protein
LGLGVGVNDAFTLSGCISGDVAGAYALRFLARCGDDEALNSFSVILYEGFFAKCEN